MKQYIKDKKWMKYAIKLSKNAEKSGEIPVGAVLLLKNNIIGKGWNNSINTNDPTAHAEIIALRNGGLKIKNYRLNGTTMYVSLEPCIMCLGAMIHARIKRLVFGARNKKISTTKSFLKITNSLNTNHKIKFTTDVLSNVCSYNIKKFFLTKRKINL